MVHGARQSIDINNLVQLPHLITTLFALITSSMRLFGGATAGRSDRLTAGFLTICVEFLVFWVPYRCFVYLREKVP